MPVRRMTLELETARIVAAVRKVESLARPTVSIAYGVGLELAGWIAAAEHAPTYVGGVPLVRDEELPPFAFEIRTVGERAVYREELGRTRWYRHEDSSVPWYWVSRPFVEKPAEPIRKLATTLLLSHETLEDVAGMKAMVEASLRGLSYSFGRRTWSERAEAELYRFRLGYRLRRLSLGIRGTIARRIYPEGEERE